MNNWIRQSLVLLLALTAAQAAQNKYSKDANEAHADKSLPAKDLDPPIKLKSDMPAKSDREFRVQKIHLFWEEAQRQVRGEQKLKVLKNELRILDKEVLKKKNVDGTADMRKEVEVRLQQLIEKVGLKSEPFSHVFDFESSGEHHRNSVLGAHSRDNSINKEMWQEDLSNDIWQRAVDMGSYNKDDLEQLKNDLERLEHRLAKKRYLERQLDEDKKSEELKKRLKEVTYKAEKERKAIEHRWFAARHAEL